MTPQPSWELLLGTPRPHDHFVQLYTDDGFFGRAVAHFLGEGLRNGEAAAIIATAPHAELITDCLSGAGVNVADAVARGQFAILDAHECLEQIMAGKPMPTRAGFLAIVNPVLERGQAAGYSSIRLFGEMVNLLWDQNLDATIRLEELWNEVLAGHTASLLCAYRIDPFDRHARRGVLHRVSR